jgi:predicted O-linked N-acetylglucosamine transferase (SPINDLY family)
MLKFLFRKRPEPTVEQPVPEAGTLQQQLTQWAELMNRGNALHALGRSEDALAEFDRAIEARPDDAGAPYNRGVVLHALGRRDEAVAAFDWAIAIKPDHLDALHNRGIVLGEQNRHAEALASYEQIVGFDPDYPHAAGNVAFERAQLCEWGDRDQVVQRVIDGIGRGVPVSVPFPVMALTQSAGTQRACAAIHVARHHPPIPNPLWNGEKYAHQRIRVAYLSADFHEHALAFLIAGMLEAHDHERFETTGIFLARHPASPMRARIEASFDRCIDITTIDDAEAARRIRELEIDIAVDLMGFSGFSRAGVFACRPAPVQVNYLGYPGTMGADYMDYILADRFLIPESQKHHCAEKVVYLPDTFQANDSGRRIADATPSRTEAGLPERGFVFCAFNNSYKITPALFSIWMRLLDRVPGSVLWLVASNREVEANLRREAASAGIAAERLVFARRMSYPEHLARYRLADLFLDTLPFNGGTTASDALWAGLPVITCAGEAFASRMAGSLLHAIGLPELVTNSLAEYEALALRLATDAQVLADLRQRLARNRDTYPLFDTDRFRRNLEAAYVTMWEKTQRGEPPASFAVSG